MHEGGAKRAKAHPNKLCSSEAWHYEVPFLLARFLYCDDDAQAFGVLGPSTVHALIKVQFLPFCKSVRLDQYAKIEKEKNVQKNFW